MTFNEYQEKSKATAIYSHAVIYPGLKLAGEAGEVSQKIGKSLRDNIDWDSSEFKTNIAKELGDVLWYIAALCRDLELDMNLVAAMNIAKLQDRKNRNVITGNGDNR